MATRTWDPRCYDLAEIFLSDDPPLPMRVHEARAKKLAGTIQEAIENWLAEEHLEGDDDADADDDTRP